MSVRIDGDLVDQLTTEKRMYMAPQMGATEVGIHSTPLEDLYIILSSVSDLQGAVVENAPEARTASFPCRVNPLVGWIGAGGFILTIGSLIAVWPGAERVRRSSGPSTAARPSRAAPAPVR